MSETPFHPPVHPGEVLREEYLEPLGLDAETLAAKLSLPSARVRRILDETEPIDVETGLRLARFFGTTDRFWLNLQMHHDVEQGKERLGSTLDEVAVLRRAS